MTSRYRHRFLFNHHLLLPSSALPLLGNNPGTNSCSIWCFFLFVNYFFWKPLSSFPPSLMPSVVTESEKGSTFATMVKLMASLTKSREEICHFLCAKVISNQKGPLTWISNIRLLKKKKFLLWPKGRLKRYHPSQLLVMMVKMLQIIRLLIMVMVTKTMMMIMMTKGANQSKWPARHLSNTSTKDRSVVRRSLRSSATL